MDVGRELRGIRERQGISLDKLSRATKISTTLLRAIERNDIESLPGEIFVRGFLKAYARQVGLDPDETVEAFLAQFDDDLPPATETEPEGSDREAAAVRSPWAARDDTEPADADARRRSTRRGLLMGGFALAIALVAYLAVRPSETPAPADGIPGRGSMREPALPPAAAEPPLSPARVASPAPLPSIAAESIENVVHLEIEATGPCWVSATADGRRALYELLQAGDRSTIDARDEIVLRIGDPAAFTYRINGRPGRPLGQPAEPVTVRLTPQTVREFAE